MDRFLLVFTILLITLFIVTDASSEELPALVLKNKCDSCHGFNPKSNRMFAPTLRYAGEKFKQEWLEKYLVNPEPIRPAGYTKDPDFLNGKAPKIHPSVSKEEAKTLTAYLMKLKMVVSKVLVASNPLSKGKKAKARIKFERDYGCTSCHQAISLVNKSRGGISGPSLVNAGNRLNPNWVYRWLKNPAAYETKSRMPKYKITEEDLVGLTKYLMTLKKENLK
tara:strand:+ start:404 stop:1069 length:666 start_codon:yes stop_codon:yes gene_type:complete